VKTFQDITHESIPVKEEESKEVEVEEEVEEDNTKSELKKLLKNDRI
jgi:seryl-tRNA synthetase